MSIRRLAPAVVVAVLALTAAVSQSPSFADDERTKDQMIADTEPEFAVDDGPTPNAAQSELAAKVTKLLTPADENNRDKDGVPPQLARGIIGFIGSPSSGYTMVVGAGAESDAVLTAAVGTLDADAKNYLAVVKAKRSATDLAKVWRAVRGYDWKPGKRLAYSLDVDPKTARVQVSISGEPTSEDREALQRIGGDAIEIETGGNFSRLSRTNDPAPHWGGAAITRTGGSCSSGFTVRGKTTGTRYSITAGHCGDNGQNWYATSFFGEMAGKANYPDYDQARLRDSTYANYLYTDGEDNYNTRLVTGANDSAINQPVCVSGKTHKSECNIIIRSLSATYCDPDGDCTTFVGRGTKSGLLGESGDSGAPVYLRNTSAARASVKGILIAGGNDVIYWERYNSLSNHLNVTAVVSP